MKRAVLVVLCFALWGCGSDDDVGESGACASGIVLHDDLYLGTSLSGPDPPAGRAVEGGIQPACNDSGPPFEGDHEVALREVSGVPPEVAVYPEWSTSEIYINTGYLTELPDHPLHDRIHGSPDRPRHRARGRACRIDGEVEAVDFSIAVRAGAGRQGVAVDARTRIEGFDRAGLPYLERGDRVTIQGNGCGREYMLARWIEPQP